VNLGATTVLFGDRNGKYPEGNSLLVAGSDETILVDPSVAVAEGRVDVPRVDRVLNYIHAVLGFLLGPFFMLIGMVGMLVEVGAL